MVNAYLVVQVCLGQHLKPGEVYEKEKRKSHNYSISPKAWGGPQDHHAMGEGWKDKGGQA